jgi:hypothetical protein
MARFGMRGAPIRALVRARNGFRGEMVQSGAGETTPAANNDCWKWLAVVRIDSPNR